jgi:hypothetical protein
MALSRTHALYDSLRHALSQVTKVEVTLRLAVSHSVSLGVDPHLGLMIRHLLLFDSYGLVFVGHPLWQEDRSVFCICCWSLPAQSFSGPSPLGLATIFYSLRFEISLLVASIDYQGHGEGILPRHHMGSQVTPSWLSLNSICTEPLENTTSNSSSIVVTCVSVTVVVWFGRRGKLFTEPLSSNGRLLWLYSSALS